MRQPGHLSDPLDYHRIGYFCDFAPAACREQRFLASRNWPEEVVRSGCPAHWIAKIAIRKR